MCCLNQSLFTFGFEAIKAFYFHACQVEIFHYFHIVK